MKKKTLDQQEQIEAAIETAAARFASETQAIPP